MIRSGISRKEIAELHIPLAAREIGERWVRDDASFAEVTIAVSRLQSLLRKLEPEPGAEAVIHADGPLILLLVSCDNDHTLGAMVLLGQLRRLGCSARLLVGAHPTTLGAEIGASRFDAVMISAAPGNSTIALHRLVLSLRKMGAGDAPIVIGGGIVESEPELLRRTGADVAESDLHRALELCDLNGTKHKLSSAGARKRHPV